MWHLKKLHLSLDLVMCGVDFAGGVLGPLSCLARLPQGCIISTFKFWLIQLLKGGGEGKAIL